MRLLLLALLATACAPATQSRAPHANWVSSTLASLTLEQKAGQLVMPWVSGQYLAVDSPEFEQLVALVEKDGVGGFVISIGMPLSYAAKLNALQQRARVPLLIASDMESGPGNRMGGIYSFPNLLPQGGGTSFPPAMGLGATGSDSLALEVGRVIAREARAVGVHVMFGPVLDVNSNPKNPIINTRSFGEDPALVARLGGALSRGAREGGLLTTVKHFPGHGDTETDSHLDLPVIRANRARLDSVELAPFRVLVRDGADGVMTAHIAIAGLEGDTAPPATLSPRIIDGILRKDLGFSGLVYTDALDMGAIVKRYGIGESAVRALEAGADILLMPTDVPETVRAVTDAVRAGRITEARLDASVRRALEAKARAGLPRSRLVDLERVDDVVGQRAHAELAQTVAERSITLARDADNLVPIVKSRDRVLVLLHTAANDPISGSTFARALRDSGRQVSVARAQDPGARALADSASIVIAAAFVSPMAFSGTIATTDSFSSLVQSLVSSGKRVIAVSFGNPYLLDAFPEVRAYMLAWGSADVSQIAAARALIGDTPISGVLPVSLPPHHVRGEGLKRAVVAATVPASPPRAQ
jgi:beta-N-acetylhexosaminidase